MNQAKLVIESIALLAPLIADVVAYLKGGPKPVSISSLPDTLQSEIELRRAEQRAEDATQ